MSCPAPVVPSPSAPGPAPSLPVPAAAPRDFPDARLVDKGGEAEVFVLNPWQARHAVLVCTAVKQIDELRFMLCPKYAGDGARRGSWAGVRAGTCAMRAAP